MAMKGRRFARSLSMAVFLLNVAAVVWQWFAPVSGMWILWLMLLAASLFAGAIIHFCRYFRGHVNSGREMLRRCPGWMIAVVVLCFCYAFFNGIFALALYGKDEMKMMIQMFTGISLAFASIAAALWAAWDRGETAGGKRDQR